MHEPALHSRHHETVSESQIPQTQRGEENVQRFGVHARFPVVCAYAISVQRKRIAPPRNVLPAAEVAQQVRRACLPYQGQVIEPQFLEPP